MTLTSGTKLGRYEIRLKIGADGMGEVYQGHWKLATMSKRRQHFNLTFCKTIKFTDVS